MSLLMLAQMDPRAVTALERMAVAQLVMAVIMVLIGLIVAGAALAIFFQLRAATRGLQRQVDELKPRMDPLLDRAREVSSDLAGMTDNVRRKADDVLHTVEQLRRSAERGSTALEERVKRFTTVLDVVQQETEELMLDAAATAHGLQETARVLREEEGRRPRARRPSGAGRQRMDDADEESRDE
jgi:uncharacterized protein YoxC